MKRCWDEQELSEHWTLFQSELQLLTKRADLGKVHPHMLRHACGYALANKGHDLRTIQDYLGHRDPKHTAIYTRTAAKRFDNLWC